jgi:hypothetical protein
MEDKKKSAVDADKEIVFSKAIKAGKRIYYLDVKKNRKDEMFLSITESKKVVTGDGFDPHVSFEKHKIFLYKEDFEKFVDGLNEMIQYIADREGPLTPYYNKEEEKTHSVGAAAEAEDDSSLESHDIKIDIDF